MTRPIRHEIITIRMDYTLKATMNSPMVVQLLDGEIQVDERFRLYPGMRIHTSLRYLFTMDVLLREDRAMTWLPRGLSDLLSGFALHLQVAYRSCLKLTKIDQLTDLKNCNWRGRRNAAKSDRPPSL